MIGAKQVTDIYITMDIIRLFIKYFCNHHKVLYHQCSGRRFEQIIYKHNKILKFVITFINYN